MSEIKNALTAEEWNPPEKDGWEATGPRSGDEAWIEGGNVWLPEYRDGEYLVANRHALAALCLYQQPFGFTVDDYDTLFQVQFAWQQAAQASGNPSPEMSERIRNVDSLRARIAALLPPDEIRKAYEDKQLRGAQPKASTTPPHPSDTENTGTL